MTFEVVDLDGTRGCHRKLWENVIEVLVKIEKTNTMTYTWERQRQTKTRMPENEKITVNFSNRLQRHLVSKMVK